MTKADWLERNGFSEDGITWCVFGEDTYSIKEHLKELGCKFSMNLKWHSAKPLNLPEGYGMFSLSFDDLFEWSDKFKNAFPYPEAKEKIQKAFKQAEGPSLSEYVGSIGERLRNLSAIYKGTRGFNSRYGWTNIHIFNIGNDVLVWFTTKDLELKKGDLVDLTGTVKSYNEYNEEKQTILSRCVIKKIG